MKVAELNFTVMYQKYITIEADDLTELLKDKIMFSVLYRRWNVDV